MESLMVLTDGAGYDDVMDMAPVSAVIDQGDSILVKDGCLNFFVGSSDQNLKAAVKLL